MGNLVWRALGLSGSVSGQQKYRNKWEYPYGGNAERVMKIVVPVTAKTLTSPRRTLNIKSTG